MFRLISVLTVFVLILVVRIPIAYSKEVNDNSMFKQSQLSFSIELLHCSILGEYSFFTQKGQPISWDNADDVDHRIVITTVIV